LEIKATDLGLFTHFVMLHLTLMIALLPFATVMQTYFMWKELLGFCSYHIVSVNTTWGSLGD